MPPADASNFNEAESEAMTLAVSHPKKMLLTATLHCPMSWWVTNSRQMQDGIYGSFHAPVQNPLLLSRNASL